MLKLLLKVRFASMFNRQRSVKGKQTKTAPKIILFLFLIFYAGASIFFLLHSMYMALMPDLIAHDMVWYVFGISSLLSLIMSLLIDSQSARSQLYESRDNDLLMAMPIKPGTILLSRLIAIYLFALIYALVLYLPAIAAAVRCGAINAFQVLCAVFSILLVECIPVAVSCLVGRFFAWVNRRFQHFRIISSVITGVLLLGYLYFSMNMSGLIAKISENAVAYASRFRIQAWPLYVAAKACTGSPLHLLLLILFTAAICIPVYFYLSKTFLSSVSVKTSRKAKRAGNAMRVHRPLWSLALREIAHFTDSSSYMVNAGFGLLIEVAFSVFYVIRGNASIGLVASSVLGETYRFAAPALILSLLQTMIQISACSVSLERNNIWIVQSLPVKSSTVLFSKALAQFVICLPFTLVSSLLCVIGAGTFNLYALWIFLAPLCMCLLVSLLGVRVNMMFPRLDFIDDITVIKRSASVIVSMLLIWLIAGISVLPVVIPGFSAHGAMALHVLIVLVSCVPIALYLEKRGAKAFAHLC